MSEDYSNTMSNYPVLIAQKFTAKLIAISHLLDLLIDINSLEKVPPHLRYDLRSPTPDASAVPPLEPDISPSSPSEVESARLALEEARQDLHAGQMTPNTYKSMEASLCAIIHHTNSLANVSRTTHTSLAVMNSHTMPIDLLDENPIGYMPPAQEDEYLSSLDTFLANSPPDIQPALPRPSRPTDREREKDSQLHNPVSVYNWLRVHRPGVFLQDPKDPKEPKEPKESSHAKDSTSEPAGHRPSPKPVSSSGTKAARRTTLVAKQETEPEPEIIDEEGFVIGGGVEIPAAKSKRKREDDAYRPKGGSSRPRKRTKGSSGTVAKKVEGEEEGI